MSVVEKTGKFARVKVPEGTVVKATGYWSGPSQLTTNRETTYRFDVLDTSGRKFGELDGVSSGSIEWNANSAVKGGGKISVSKANKIHKQDIRISKNKPVHATQDFESDTEDYNANGLFTQTIGVPRVIERTTQTVFEGSAALHVEFSTPKAPVNAQNAITPFTGCVPGQKYTYVARVLNTSAPNLFLMAAFIAQDVPIPQSDKWQTVRITFTPNQDMAFAGIINYAPQDGQHVYVDAVEVYEGVTTGFNGEVFDYAPFSWVHARIRPVMCVEGMDDEPLGVFVPSAPVEQWDDGGGRQEIELLDRTTVIAQDYMTSTYTVKKGTNVISAVRKIIASTGEPVGALTPSNETVKSNMVWGPGSSKLTIINELLDAAGFFALWSDGNGQFRVQEYVSPKKRPVVYEFLDDENSIYIPSLSIDRDIYDIPNRVIMTAQGDGESEGWTSIATNQNEKSPFSYQSRGRWITDVQLSVEATSKESLDQKAKNRLASLSATQAAVSIQHAPIPFLKVNDVVRLRRKPADLNTIYTVTKTAVDFNSTSLAKTTLSEVVDL